MRSKVKLFVVSMFFVPRLGKVAIRKDSLFIWTLNRPDYKKLSAEYKKKLGWDFQEFCVGADVIGYKFRFDLSVLLGGAKIVSRLANLGVFDRIIVFLSVVRSLNSWNYFQSTLDLERVKRCLSFNSSYEYESVFTHYLRSRDIETFSMQHGMYFKFENETPIDVINYENIAAGKILVWGDFTKEQIAPYIPSATRTIVFGNPCYGAGFNPVVPAPSNRVLVCLPRRSYLAEIWQLVTLIQSDIFSEFIFVLRFHPSVGVVEVPYQKDNIVPSDKSSLSEDLLSGKVSRVIGFNSTALFECAAFGYPVIQYISGNDEVTSAGFDQFSSAAGLHMWLAACVGSNLDASYYFGSSESKLR
ncbi:hypothetical protein HNQ57_002000 [Zhongshania antarctica]|uniref:Uncharacterized protein n=1 Tax=Zhongshania antarctica TaxID=641702 RepID=A0A840R5N1_9GAMM|nr:hypothetical protein [Zhongshania antarctica]MBB5187722.1 hypothetical protein [Zhongshania antarctica]